MPRKDAYIAPTQGPSSQADFIDIQIRPFRNSDSNRVKALYMSFLVEDNSPFILLLRSHRTKPLSLFSYLTGFLGISLVLLSKTSTPRYTGLALMSFGIFIFYYPLRFLRAAFDDYVTRSLQGDMKDISKHYGVIDDGKSGESYCNGKSGFWVAEATGNGLEQAEIVGCIGLDNSATPDETVSELRRVVVSSKYRRRGIAQQLLRTVVDHCKSTGTKTIFLTTSFYQVAAINMYKKLGFRVEKIREISMKLHKVQIYHFVLDMVDYKL